VNPKQGQIQVTFHWAYVLIAGAIILLFFVGLVVKQKDISEQQLSQDVVRLMESIFTASEVSEKTKNFVDTSGLSDYTFYFECEDAVGTFGVEQSDARIENTGTPIFTPQRLSSSQIITWSLPYHLPFKVVDFLFVTSRNTKYVLLGDFDFATEFMNSTDGFNREYFASGNLNEVEVGDNFQIRIIDSGAGVISEGVGIPAQLQQIDHGKLTAVVLGDGTATYYQAGSTKEQWVRQSGPVKIISSYGEDRDSATYAAIFTHDAATYTCNMGKAFKRLNILMELYDSKRSELGLYYQDHLDVGAQCFALIKDPQLQNTLAKVFPAHKGAVSVCSGEAYVNCEGLATTAEKLAGINDNLRKEGCVSLY
jgi:hypothetical protein